MGAPPPPAPPRDGPWLATGSGAHPPVGGHPLTDGGWPPPPRPSPAMGAPPPPPLKGGSPLEDALGWNGVLRGRRSIGLPLTGKDAQGRGRKTRPTGGGDSPGPHRQVHGTTTDEQVGGREEGRKGRSRRSSTRDAGPVVEVKAGAKRSRAASVDRPSPRTAGVLLETTRSKARRHST